MTSGRGFTMIELLISVALTATIVAAGLLAFTTATSIWRNGTDTADAIHHGDYVMGQIVSALRSAYYPDATAPSTRHGMVLENDGDEEEAHDKLSWVKLGAALVGGKSGFADTPHRIELSTVEEGKSDKEGFAEGGLVIRSWRLSAQTEDFDPADNDDGRVREKLLMPDVLALDFKVLNPEGNLENGEDPDFSEDDLDTLLDRFIDEDWKDDYTNRLPYMVMATLYIKPAQKGEEPIPLRRLVRIPAAPLSWRDKGAAGGDAGTSGDEGEGDGKKRNGGDRGNGGGGRNI